jgi:hypothetical protein
VRESRRTPDLLHNMSVPSSSRLTVRRAIHPGRRFLADLPSQLPEGDWEYLDAKPSKRVWRWAWSLLERAGDPPPLRPRERRTREALERHLAESLRRARVPDRIGVFLLEGRAGPRSPARPRLLRPAAGLAVLARRSGPLYLATRALDPSLANTAPAVLFFPEEPR